MKKFTAPFFITCIFLTLQIFTSCRKHEFAISVHPKPVSFNRGALAEFPATPSAVVRNGIYDLRSYDLSGLDGADVPLSALFRSDFDSSTLWPGNLPAAFRPDSILDIGKNSGLGIRALHSRGYRGKNISIGIIGEPLLLSHSEYAGRVRLYEELNIRTGFARLPGCAIASLAAGSSCGTAPEADLFYIAQSGRETGGGQSATNLHWLALALERLLEINDSLGRSEKIRVICISESWDEGQQGFSELAAALYKARNEKIFIVSTRLEKMYGIALTGLGREVYDDPDTERSYKQAVTWSETFTESLDREYSRIFVPVDSRTAAGTASDNDYVFYRSGSSGFALAWLSGLYALCLEMYPKLEPELFLQTLLATSSSSMVKLYAREYPLTGIANPQALIKKLLEFKNR